jgi:hypothetical protein
MNSKTLLLGIMTLVISGTIIAPQAALAYKGDPNVRGPNCTQERHEAMEKAFDNNDYNAWKNLMQGKGKVTEVINEKNFAKFAQAHKLAEQGKTAEANKIRTELGLGQQNGSGQSKGYGRTNR